MTNPFQLTRAADLDDEQITRLWVDPNEQLIKMLRPASRLPMLILGGRGSGKTHLLRYYSYPVQKRVHGAGNMLEQVRQAGYIGIHTRCMGLYFNRFSSKRMTDEQWQSLFAHYVELWFGQLILNTAVQFLEDAEQLKTFDEYKTLRSLSKLVEGAVGSDLRTLKDFSGMLWNLQRELDDAVNMASFRTPISPRFLVTPGTFTFGIPRILASSVPCLEGVQFTLFIDEYEHLYAEQQKNLNTLIRERENPVSFKVGARLHGIKTYQTWGGDEELKEGSDYELLKLDAALRNLNENYIEFATQLCLARIKFEQKEWPTGWNDSNASEKLFETFEKPVRIEEIVRAQLKNGNGGSPWILGVSKAVNKFLPKLGKLGVKSESDVEEIVANLEFPDDPLIEKTSTFLFYGHWEDGRNLLDSSKEIGISARRYAKEKDTSTLHAKKLQHFSEDMRDQMLADLNLDRKAGPVGLMARYIGLETWIRMSDGIVRNLVTTLKHVYDWSLFSGENIYAVGGISLNSQMRAIQEVSQWFVNDANVLENDRGMVETGIKRVATLIRKLRFSEKPPECSLCRFSVNLNAIDPKARRIIEAAEMWSFLIRDSDRKQRNPGEQLTLLRINPLVAPEYYLPISARGDIQLSVDEVVAMFSIQEESNYKTIERARVARCSPPFVKSNKATTKSKSGTSDGEFNLF